MVKGSRGVVNGGGAPLSKRYPDLRLAVVCILPAAAIMIVITFYPIFYQFWMSFTNFELKHLRSMDPEGVGIKNFTDVMIRQLPLPNYDFKRILIFNTLWTVINVLLHISIGIAIAVALNQKGLPARRLYRTIFVLPWALPSLVSGMIWANMWHERFGGVNLLLQRLGFEGTTRWLTDTTPIVNYPELGLVLPMAAVVVLVSNVWLGWPFMMVIATGALQSIPSTLYESAMIDGVGRWGQFWRLTLPLLRPAMVPAVMIGIMMTFNQFNIIYFVSGGGPLGLTEILVTQGFKLVNPQGWYGVAAAFNIIVFLILAVITLITNRITRATEPYYV